MLQTGIDSATALRVLVVDDSAVLRDHVRVALEDAGPTVVGEAADGAHALTQAATRDPDVMLMDLCMPGMDGIQAARALREQRPWTRVVLWTGEDDAHLASAVRKSGAHAGVAKGTHTVELVANVRSVCEVSTPEAGRRPAAGLALTEPTGKAQAPAECVGLAGRVPALIPRRPEHDYDLDAFRARRRNARCQPSDQHPPN